MSWSKYAEFLAFAVVLIVIPGPDFAVVTKNTLVGGRRRGRWTARRLLMRRKVRRTLDATTGTVLLGFGAKLATEHV